MYALDAFSSISARSLIELLQINFTSETNITDLFRFLQTCPNYLLEEWQEIDMFNLQILWAVLFIPCRVCPVVLKTIELTSI